jgi:drug/metabolite transporter (DMT)-like permease
MPGAHAMTHARAVAAMVAVTLMWSIAGVVSRWIDAAQGFEITFWRSTFNGVALAVLLSWRRGPRALLHSLRGAGPAVWASALCWCVMFTAFMTAITLTTVANVLVTMALAPLFTALIARAALGHRMQARTWWAIAGAGSGIAWMFGGQVQGGDARHWLGVGVALAVPVAAAVNWTLLQRERARGAGPGDAPTDLMPAVLLGALLSALLTAVPALPWRATPHDLGWLALLGAVQLAIPCLLAVAIARLLSAPEMALLSLLEVVFGVAWAWLGAGEAPAAAVLGGGALVLASLAWNEAASLGNGRARAGGGLTAG